METSNRTSLETRVLEHAAHHGLLGARVAAHPRPVPSSGLPPSAPSASRLESGKLRQALHAQARRMRPAQDDHSFEIDFQSGLESDSSGSGESPSSGLPPSAPSASRLESGKLRQALHAQARRMRPAQDNHSFEIDFQNGLESDSSGSGESSSSDEVSQPAPKKFSRASGAAVTRRAGQRQEIAANTGSHPAQKGLTSYSVLDLNSRIYSKKELSRWIRQNRKHIRWALGALLVVIFFCLFSMLLEMSSPKLPGDLSELPPEAWRASGLRHPRGNVPWPHPAGTTTTTEGEIDPNLKLLRLRAERAASRPH